MIFKKETVDWSNSFRGQETKIPVMDLDQRLRKLEATLPQLDQFVKYPALAEAYREYKTIERLILGNK